MISAIHAKRFLNGLFVAVLALGLAQVGCKKKEEPNVTYDSQSSSSAGGEKGTVGESDLGEGGSKGGSAAISGMQTVYFEYDSSSLSSGARKAIESNAKTLKGNKSLSITIEGHCDERGATQYNLALGERRANSVRDYMANLGVSKSRMKTISYGEERPAVVGSDESAWSKNRRAEFTGK